VSIRQLVEDFASYPYLPRLQSPEVLTKAIQDGLALLTWEQDAFAYAESYDEEAKRYRGLRTNQQVAVGPDDPGLLVRPAVARAQIEAESQSGNSGLGGGEKGTIGGSGGATGGEGVPGPTGGGTPAGPVGPEPKPQPKRYHATVALDPMRVGRDAARVADEVIVHLTALGGARVRVTLEIEAEVPDGVPEHVVRIVTENGRALKFESQGFEEV